VVETEGPVIERSPTHVHDVGHGGLGGFAPAHDDTEVIEARQDSHGREDDAVDTVVGHLDLILQVRPAGCRHKHARYGVPVELVAANEHDAVDLFLRDARI